MGPTESINVTKSLHGEVKVYSIKGGKRKLLKEKSNTVLANAKLILANCLAGIANASPDIMNAYNLATSIAILGTTSRVTVQSTAVPGGPYTVEFEGLFESGSFAGDFDTIRLANSIYGDFSQLDITGGLTKDPTEQILVIWKIKFI